MHRAHRLLHRLTEPPARPTRRLIGYYVGLAVVSMAWRRLMPPLPLVDRWPDLALMGTMVTALVLMLPVTWVYLGTRRGRGPDHSLVQTMLALPVAVAGVITVVQNSLPLAFSLAGIVAAVRFRNTLKDAADMLFVFLAIAVGLVVGTQAFGAAATMSIVFNLVVLTLWHCDAAPDRNAVEARIQTAPSTTASQNGKKRRYTRELSVQVSDGEVGQRAVEEVLRTETEKWRIDEIKKKRDGRTTLRYVVRIDKAQSPELVLDTLLSRAAPHVLGVAFN